MDEEIPPAVDFVKWIEQAIGRAGVMIAVIGPTWLTASDREGRPRIDDERDFVRSEIAAALERGMEVLPVLVAGAKMPTERELPPALARLAHINALELPDGPYWHVGTDRLIERAAELLHDPAPHHPTPEPASLPRGASRRVLWIALAGVSLLALGFVLLSRVFITPDFGPFLGVSPALFTTPAPAGILVAAVIAAARGRRGGSGAWLNVGLLAGFGLAAVAKGVSLLGESARGAKPGAVLWILGGIVVAAAAVAGARSLADAALLDSPRARRSRAVTVLAIVGAGLLVAGSVMPVTFTTEYGRAVVTGVSWNDVEPVVEAASVVAAVALLHAGRSRTAAGALIALGLASALLWVRDIGIPAAEWMNGEGYVAPRPGGFVGLAGSIAVLAAGWWVASAPASFPSRTAVASPAGTASSDGAITQATPAGPS